MRSLNLLVCLFILAGCAETFNGPRVVRYSEDRFYIRYVPGLTPEQETRSIDELAQTLCNRTNSGEAKIVSSDQFLPVDVRYRTFQCVNPQDEDMASESAPET